MKYSIDDAVKLMADVPWDLRLVVRGQELATRPMDLGDLARLRSLKTMSPDGANVFFAGLFQEPRPDVSGWEMAEYLGVASAISAYQSERVSENSQRIAAEVRAAAVRELAI